MSYDIETTERYLARTLTIASFHSSSKETIIKGLLDDIAEASSIFIKKEFYRNETAKECVENSLTTPDQITAFLEELVSLHYGGFGIYH